MKSKRANYGVDGPIFVLNTFWLGCLLLGTGLLLTIWLSDTPMHEVSEALIAFAGVICFAVAATILYGSKIGKLRLRDKIIGSLSFCGDEKVLGVGCGHGLLIIAAAKRLNQGGKGIVIDIWKKIDQAGNSPRAFLRNAEIEAVTDRVSVETADARQMPFADESFDYVLSSWVLHNIVRRRERERALAEIVRVLKPNGEIVIADVWLGFQYASFFRQKGLVNIAVSRPYFLFFAPTFVVRARKKPLV